MALPQNRFDSYSLTSHLLVAAFLMLVLLKGLLAAFFSGLLVYSLIHQITPILGRRISNERARLLAVAVLGGVVVGVLILLIWGTLSFLQSDAGSAHSMLKKLADIIDQSRDQLPSWVQEYLPVNVDALRELLSDWFREHAVEAKAWGAEAGRIVAHVLVGLVIGAMLALEESHNVQPHSPLVAALLARVRLLYAAFRDIVFAQVWISAINAIITGVFVLVILPLAGVSLPLSKSLVIITFVAGLLPVVGNLISNTVFVIVGLSHSLQMAMVALLFMVVVHKLEYFLNARIIGSKIHAHAWELLAVILVAESVFGLPGVVAAPVFYAYMKKELLACQLI